MDVFSEVWKWCLTNFDDSASCTEPIWLELMDSDLLPFSSIEQVSVDQFFLGGTELNDCSGFDG